MKKYRIVSMMATTDEIVDPTKPANYPEIEIPDNAIGISMFENPVKIIPKIAKPNGQPSIALMCRITYLVPLEE